MTFSQASPRALLAFMALELVQIIAGVLVPLPMVVAPHFLLWLALSNALTAAALSFAAARAEWRAWRLGVAIASLPLFESLIDLIEAAVYLPNTPLSSRRVFLFKLVSAILLFLSGHCFLEEGARIQLRTTDPSAGNRQVRLRGSSLRRTCFMSLCVSS